MELFAPKKLNKTFLKFLAPKNLINFLRRNWMLELPLYLTGCSNIQFFCSFFVTYVLLNSCASAHLANLLPTKAYNLVGSIYVLRAAADYYIKHLSLVLISLY